MAKIDAKVTEVRVRYSCPNCGVDLWTFKESIDLLPNKHLKQRCWNCSKETKFLVKAFTDENYSDS